MRQVSELEILTPELDEGIHCVQEGADAWCYDPKIGRQFAKLSIRYADSIAPEGWQGPTRCPVLDASQQTR